jgi:hypothetical protein
MHRLLALSTTIGGTGNADTPFSPAANFTNFGSLVSVIVTNAIAAAGVIAFIFIIIAGFGIIAGAGGDPKKVESSKNTLTMAIVGLLIVVFSLWFVQAMKIFLGFDPLKPPTN